MPYTIVMKLEQVLPMLRDGKTITRTKPVPSGFSVLFVKINGYEQLVKKFVLSTGEEMDWSWYRVTKEDVMAENWEVAG